MSTHNLCFGSKIKKTPAHHSFTVLKWGVRGCSIHGHVCMMFILSIYGVHMLCILEATLKNPSALCQTE